jgi:hypothetical protein
MEFITEQLNTAALADINKHLRFLPKQQKNVVFQNCGNCRASVYCGLGIPWIWKY